jgi:hypothetical protein
LNGGGGADGEGALVVGTASVGGNVRMCGDTGGADGRGCGGRCAGMTGIVCGAAGASNPRAVLDGDMSSRSRKPFSVVRFGNPKSSSGSGWAGRRLGAAVGGPCAVAGGGGAG